MVSGRACVSVTSMESLVLEGKSYSIDVRTNNGKFEQIAFTNTKTGDLIISKTLFTITEMNDHVLSSADFEVEDFAREPEHVLISMRHARFFVTCCIHLSSSRNHASVEFSFASLHDDTCIQALSILPFTSQAPFVYGSVKSSPIISDTFFITPQSPFMITRAYEGGVTQTLPVKLPLQRCKPLVCTTYVGTFTAGQLRRDFNEFINDARDRKYAPYLHYNSWLDIGFFNPYTEPDALSRIHQFGKNLVTERSVLMNGFLFDDGWDDLKGNWAFSEAFPDGVSKLKSEAEKYHTQLGIWLSPWGGYGKPLHERVSHAGEFGYELSEGKFALSGPVYFENFNERVLSLIKEQGVTHFKFDGTGNADKLIEGSHFTSDFDAAIGLISNARNANRDVYINLTTGTYATPAWLFFADSIWRGGDDVNFYGVGSKVQQWITYRDAETHRSVVRNGPLFPLNSLMLHGLVYAKQAEHLDKQSPTDFADQAWSFFATGTQLQELYITPELLNDENWDILAKAAKWSQENKDILFDTHWIGGDPTRLDIYGWAAWHKSKSILTLRNPAMEDRHFLIDLKGQLEIPSGETTTFKVEMAYGNNPGVPEQFSNVSVVKLAPLELITLVLQPV